MMNEKRPKLRLIFTLVAMMISLFSLNAQAALPKFNLQADGSTTKQVPVNGSVSVSYTLSNNMKRSVSLELQPQAGITQDTSGGNCPNPIVLESNGEANASCTLVLTITGSAFASEADGTVVISNKGPVVCNKTTNGTKGIWCSQPLPQERLAITKIAAETPTLSVSPSLITITKGEDAGAFTITNDSDTVTATEVAVTEATLPEGVTQNAEGCETIAPEDSCTLSLTAGEDADADTYNITIQGDNTEALSAEVVVEASGPAIGEALQGGVVACLDGENLNLIAATADNSSSIAWGSTNVLTGAQNETNGATNTQTIVAELGVGSDYAAKLCSNYSVTEGDTTYNDWFLPAKDQLNCLYGNKDVLDSFSDFYWSSTESSGDPANFAWLQNFGSGIQFDGGKDSNLRVRCVRAFVP